MRSAQSSGQGDHLILSRNWPLPQRTSGAVYRECLSNALSHLQQCNCHSIVVSLGFDTIAQDHRGNGFQLEDEDLFEVGFSIAKLALPILIIQEGGYVIERLEAASEAFFRGLAKGAITCPDKAYPPLD